MKNPSTVGLPWNGPAWLAIITASLLWGGRTSPASTLLTCPYQSGGNQSTCGFYIASYPGISLESLTLQLFNVSSPGTYNLTLTVRSNVYNGPILGTATTTAAISGSLTPVMFVFPALHIVRGSRVCFALTVNSGPAAYVYVASGSCSEVVETVDTTPPLSVNRAWGVALTLAGAPSLQVTNGWSIQAAINAAASGDTVSVGPGTYYEDISLKSGVNVIGAGSSSTLLRGTGTNNVVAASGVTNARLAGFTITGAGTNGNCCSSGLMLESSTLVADNNCISSNVNGITIIYGSPIIRNNIIRGNGCPPGGCSFRSQGIWCNHATALIANNLIAGNYCNGLFLVGADSRAQVINNTIADNLGPGIECDGGDRSILKNNIVARNVIGIYAASAGTTPAISYHDVWGNTAYNYQAAGGGVTGPGPGDISADPLFDSTSPVLYALAPASPCIHAGDPDPSYNNPDGTRNTMGAYGGPSAMTPLTGLGVASGFVFTSVGLVPTALITNSGSLAGLANVPTNVAAALYLPAWKDAPFGGLPYLYGLFGSSDTLVQYYQIWGAPWRGGSRPATADFQPILDPLSKYKYVIQTNGSVQMTLVNVGPDANGLYLRTDRPDSGYWSAPDLKLVLNSYRLTNGLWDFICVGFSNDTASAAVNLPTNQLSRLTLWIDNTPVSVAINSVRDQASNAIPECGIISVATSTQNLQFEITVSHPSGFLEGYYVESDFGRNHLGGFVTTDQYKGVHDSPGPLWSGPGTLIVNSQPAQMSGRLANWVTCAYAFTLGATARTINGFDRIYGNWYADHYYIIVGSAVPSCAADLNGDGRVDGLDLALFAARYGTTNCASLPLLAPLKK